MTSFIGRSGYKALFTEDDRAVIVDTRVAVVVASGAADELTAALAWGDGEITETDLSIAELALSSMSEPLPELTGRLYTIPRGVQATAKKALAEASNESSAVARRAGALLAAGGQIDFSHLVNIVAYFQRADTVVASALDFGDDAPQAPRGIDWKLRGGDAAQKWASTIVEREPMVPSAPPTVPNLSEVLAENPEAGPEFIARVLGNGEGIDRLYRIDLDGRTYVWDRTTWDDLGQQDLTIWQYDAELDGEESTRSSTSTHVMIDPESAIQIAALFASGSANVFIEDLDINESILAMDAASDMDWELLDSTLIAAASGAVGDGIYSADERSENASAQVRDATGRFATVGQQMVNPKNLAVAGKITAIDPVSKMATLMDSKGITQTAPVSDLTPGVAPDNFVPGKPLDIPRVDFSGILAEPRTPINRQKGTIPGTLPALTSNDLRGIINDFPAWVKAQRDAFVPQGGSKSVGVQAKNSLNRGSAGRAMEKESGKKVSTNAYDHPMLSKWLNKKNNRGYYENRLWYKPITAGAATPVSGEVTPDNTDVQPLYLAIVSPDDPRAVFKLISLVPASAKSTSPMVYSREEGEWSRDEQTLNDLNSATPPPVVPLDPDSLQDVITQVDNSQQENADEDAVDPNEGEEFSADEFVDESADKPAPTAEETTAVAPEAATAPAPVPVAASATSSEFDLMVLWGPRKDIMQAVVAAGGADRNRGGAEKLRRYWTFGPGGAKIMWNTGGDWTRCVRYLSKYLGARAKGYCALRHKEMTGHWTGDKAARQTFSMHSALPDSTDFLVDYDTLVASSDLRIRSGLVRERMNGLTASSQAKYEVYNTDTREGLTAAANAADFLPLEDVGAPFFIPLALPENLESGDGRSAKKYSISLRDLPMSLLWQINTADGHAGAVVVGRIERLGRVPGGIGAGYGHFDTGVYGREAQRMVANNMLRFVSADMDKFEATKGTSDEASEDDNIIKSDKMVISSARVMAVTIVAKPAFQECTIKLVPDAAPEVEVIPDGIYVEDTDPLEAAALVAAGYVASAIPLAPPTAWFGNPDLRGRTPLTVDDDGRVFGHIATWDMDHTSPALFNVRPPRSRTNYSYFNKGVVRTEDGTDVTVGQLTLAGGHAGMQASAREAVKHYDDTASAVADVHAGEDEFGIWVAGSLRTTVQPEQVRALRASTPSGDWRPIKGSLELIAVCQVNVPGFPIARAMVASGHVTALVAAGAADLAQMKSDPMAEMASRLEALEQFTAQELQKKASAVRDRIAPVLQARDAELSNRSEAVLERMSSFGYVPKKVRDAERVRNTSVASLREIAAARAAQFASADPTEAEKRKAAELLKKQGITPKRSADPKDPKAGEDAPAKYTPGHQPRDYNGQFRDILARLKENLGDDGNQGIVDKIKDVNSKAETGDYAGAVKAGVDLKSTLDRLDSGALDADSISNVRKATKDLGSVIANLPLPFGKEAEKLRFSDLPPTLRDLVDDFIDRVVDKIGAKDAASATAKLKAFKSGSDLFSQSEISAEMNKLLRLLT